jgi:hypothetical protein
MHNVTTKLSPDDFDDVELGARIGRACYELYHQVPSGVCPDSVHYIGVDGRPIPYPSIGAQRHGDGKRPRIPKAR